MSIVLEVGNLAKSYDGKKYALKDCNFKIEKGSICAIIGESGSGKSTLLRMIAGLERPTDGWIKIKERTVSDDRQIVAPQNRSVGFVFQNYALFPHLTVGQNITFGLKKNHDTTLKELLSMIKMEEYGNSYPSQLSGGQEQRVALARTLAMKPEILLLDEPFSNLDAHLKSELRGEIKNIVNKLEATMVFITHDILDAIDIADHIIFLQEGSLIEAIDVEHLFTGTKSNELSGIVADLKDNAKGLLARFS